MASTDALNNNFDFNNNKDVFSLHHVIYSIKHFFGLTEAARVERELNSLSLHELNDIGLSRSDTSHIVKRMVAQEK